MNTGIWIFCSDDEGSDEENESEGDIDGEVRTEFHTRIQWWSVYPDTFVPGWFFRINEFTGLLNHTLVLLLANLQ